MKYLSPHLLATFIRVACFLLRQARRRMRGLKALPQSCAQALQRPHIQHRLALLFAAILAFLLVWPLFLSLLPHAPLTFIVEL
jgi:hypothetical protein